MSYAALKRSRRLTTRSLRTNVRLLRRVSEEQEMGADVDTLEPVIDSKTRGVLFALRAAHSYVRAYYPHGCMPVQIFSI